MAFSLRSKQVSFLKGAEPGRRHRIPEKFPRGAQRALGSLRCSRRPRPWWESKKSERCPPGRWHRAWGAPLPCPARYQPLAAASPAAPPRTAAFPFALRGPETAGVPAERRCGPESPQAREGWRGAGGPGAAAAGPPSRTLRPPRGARPGRSAPDARSRNSLKFAKPRPKSLESCSSLSERLARPTGTGGVEGGYRRGSCGGGRTGSRHLSPTPLRPPRPHWTRRGPELRSAGTDPRGQSAGLSGAAAS